MQGIFQEPSHTKQLGFGGGCHWCTEAVFDHLVGVSVVQQGWIKSIPPDDGFSEAVLIDYDPKLISEEVLVHIHLLTHASTSNHRMRKKYRSAIYFVQAEDQEGLEGILSKAKEEDSKNYVTKILPMLEFQSNSEEFLHYYKTRPEAPFCETHIHPKLRKLMNNFGKHVKKPGKKLLTM